MKTRIHNADLCVVGGGLAGMCAAIAAARKGVKVVLVHDRPVLGGNASSEIRMHICGAHGANNKETGIVEEIELENRYRNTYTSYSIWDSVLYEKARFQENLTLLLNCTCTDAKTGEEILQSIRAWQMTTETWHTVNATLFADCSGDGILAPLSGAEFRIGREAKTEFDEDIAPDTADNRTMGMSCLIQARETESPKKFIPPAWAHKYLDDKDFNNRHHVFAKTNFWWMEVGGEDDSIHDTEELRDELLKIAFGIWDHIKNHGDHGAENWVLDWVGSLPGKRESRRYVGDHILTANNVRDEGRFDDMVAYGGWSMDDHHPGGIRHKGAATIFHPAPSPYGIPYRCLYSRNISNLFCAGRNISASHMAMSSTRVMSTCATMGQAVGNAAVVAVRNRCTPRHVYESHIKELKQMLMMDDCYLPGNVRAVSPLTGQAEISASAGDPAMLRNGVDRPVGDEDNAWHCSTGDFVEYRFAEPVTISGLRLVFDSDLNRSGKNMPCVFPLDNPQFSPPASLVRAFHIVGEDAAGESETLFEETNNYQRLFCQNMRRSVVAIRLVVDKTWGDSEVSIFAMDVLGTG